MVIQKHIKNMRHENCLSTLARLRESHGYALETNEILEQRKRQGIHEQVLQKMKE